MPIVSMFYGIIIKMFNYDNQKHHLPHIHTEYQGAEASFNIEDGALIAGEFPRKQQRLVLAWIELHKDELLADWALAIAGEKIFKIKPLE